MGYWLKFRELHPNASERGRMCAACNFIIWAALACLLRLGGVSLTAALCGFTVKTTNLTAVSVYSRMSILCVLIS